MVKSRVYKSLRNFDDIKLNKISPELPVPPVRWVVVGSSGSGKTNLIKNILFEKKFGYCKYFDEIYVFSGSKDDVEEYQGYANKMNMQNKMKVFQKFDEEGIKGICDEVETENNSFRIKNPTRVLFVLDDQLVNGISKISKMNVVDEIFVRGRHCQISCIISTQKYTALNQNIRKLNASAITVFSETNRSDLLQVADDHAELMNPKEMMELFKQHLKEKYSFITIDTKRPYNERILDKEFHPIHFDGNEDVEEEKEDDNEVAEEYENKQK